MELHFTADSAITVPQREVTKTIREDNVRVQTLSSRAQCWQKGGKTVREDDLRVLTLSSRAQYWQNGGKTVNEDDVRVLTLSSQGR